MAKISEMILRKAYRTVLSKETRRSLTFLSQLRILFALGDRRPPLESISEFSDKSIVVLAPHMDDEVLGCGGILRRHVLAGAHVTVVYMTDGRRGKPELYQQNLSKEDLTREEDHLVLLRKEEAARAAKIVGIQELLFLDYPDGSLESSPTVVDRLRKILEERRPSIIYLPSPLDLHPDHWATNCILHDATKNLVFSGDWRPAYRAYEVWSALLVNRVADISDFIELKRAAAREYKTQISYTDFVHAVVGLNAYRSLYHLGGRGFAEAFYEGTPQQYRLFFERLQSE